MADTKEKIDLLKIRLRKQAIEAAKLVQKANEAGDFQKAVEIQEKNVRVFALLDISMEEVRGSKRMLKTKKSSTESVRTGDKEGTFVTRI